MPLEDRLDQEREELLDVVPLPGRVAAERPDGLALVGEVPDENLEAPDGDRLRTPDRERKRWDAGGLVVDGEVGLERRPVLEEEDAEARYSGSLIP